jgi:hypothetical protein
MLVSYKLGFNDVITCTFELQIIVSDCKKSFKEDCINISIAVMPLDCAPWPLLDVNVLYTSRSYKYIN